MFSIRLHLRSKIATNMRSLCSLTDVHIVDFNQKRAIKVKQKYIASFPKMRANIEQHIATVSRHADTLSLKLCVYAWLKLNEPMTSLCPYEVNGWDVIVFNLSSSFQAGVLFLLLLLLYGQIKFQHTKAMSMCKLLRFD